MTTDILIIGSGGREHALAWKLKQSKRVGQIYVAPGNGGTSRVAHNVQIGGMEFDQLVKFASEKSIGLTICSMDDPLAGGIVDFFRSKDLRIWGPTKAAAQIEWSKAFSKQLMADAKVPTAKFRVFKAYAPALAYVEAQGVPIVIKASGLALGKGVYVCKTLDEAKSALDEILIQKVHKEAGAEVVVEEYLDGPEISMHALCDGLSFKLLPASQDHKTIGENDTGKNTGGMGVIAPVPWMNDNMMSSVEERVVRPTIEALTKRGIRFTGLLYPGLKMTLDGPKVLEFNARFGDPECQTYMRLMKSDLLDALEACIDGTLMSQHIEWRADYAVNIVLASGGYPDEYKKDLPITGIEEAEKVESVVVFHAGTLRQGDALTTSGGRVLGVSATGESLKQALDRAYEAIGKIHFDDMYFRRDIGRKALL